MNEQEFFKFLNKKIDQNFSTLIIVTGKLGSGKSTLIKKLIKQLKLKEDKYYDAKFDFNKNVAILEYPTIRNMLNKSLFFESYVLDYQIVKSRDILHIRIIKNDFENKKLIVKLIIYKDFLEKTIKKEEEIILNYGGESNE
ncbi:MAG: P-loop NTPase fold protein [Promethearchaeota archaeon]